MHSVICKKVFDKKVDELNFTGADTITSIMFSKETQKPGSSKLSIVITNLVVVVVFLHGPLQSAWAPRVP